MISGRIPARILYPEFIEGFGRLRINFALPAMPAGRSDLNFGSGRIPARTGDLVDLPAQILEVDGTGFEPVTFRMSSERSNQLS